MAHAIPARLRATYTASAGRKFGLTLGTAFAFFATAAWWRGHMTLGLVTGALGLVLIVAGATVPSRLRPVDRAWMRVAQVISRVTTPIIMGAVYFIVVTPVGILRRMFGTNALVHRPGRHGFWVERTRSNATSLERLF